MVARSTSRIRAAAAYTGVVGAYVNYRIVFHDHSGHLTITLQCVAHMKDGASQRIS